MHEGGPIMQSIYKHMSIAHDKYYTVLWTNAVLFKHIDRFPFFLTCRVAACFKTCLGSAQPVQHKCFFVHEFLHASSWSHYGLKVDPRKSSCYCDLNLRVYGKKEKLMLSRTVVKSEETRLSLPLPACPSSLMAVMQYKIM